MASINLLEDYYSLTSSGVFSTQIPIPTGANRFELWYKIDNYNYNPVKRAIISITFKSPDKSDTTGLSIRPVFNLCVSENTGWNCITFDLPQTVNELSWIVLNGEYTVTWEMYVNTVEATVSVDKGLEYDASGILNVNPSTAEDNELQTNSKTITGAINEVFQCTTDAFNTFATSIKSKGGIVSKVGTNYTKTEIDNGILSISGGGGINTSIYTKSPNIYYASEERTLAPRSINSTSNYPSFKYIDYINFWTSIFQATFLKNINYYLKSENNGTYNEDFVYLTGDYGIGALSVVIKVKRAGDNVFPTFDESYRATLMVVESNTIVWSMKLTNDWFNNTTSWVLTVKLAGNYFMDDVTKTKINTNRPITSFRLLYNTKYNYDKSVMFGLVQNQIPVTPNGYYHVKNATLDTSLNKKIPVMQSEKIGYLVDTSVLTDIQKQNTGYDKLVMNGREYTGIYQTNLYLDYIGYYYHGINQKRLINVYFIGDSVVDVYDIIN